MLHNSFLFSHRNKSQPIIPKSRNDAVDWNGETVPGGYSPSRERDSQNELCAVKEDGSSTFDELL